MLYPESNECRMVTGLDGFWNFKVEEQPIDPAQPLSNPITMAVPASFNDQVIDQQIRNFIIDHYPQIAHAIQQLDPLVVAKNEQANDQNATQLSKWLKVNDFLAVQLARVKVEDVEEPFIK